MLLNYVIAASLAAIRIGGHKSKAFQAVAHLYVGGLFAWSVCEIQFHFPNAGVLGFLQPNDSASQKFYLAFALSLIELGCFLWQRFVRRSEQ